MWLQFLARDVWQIWRRQGTNDTRAPMPLQGKARQKDKSWKGRGTLPNPVPIGEWRSLTRIDAFCFRAVTLCILWQDTVIYSCWQRLIRDCSLREAVRLGLQPERQTPNQSNNTAFLLLSPSSSFFSTLSIKQEQPRRTGLQHWAWGISEGTICYNLRLGTTCKIFFLKSLVSDTRGVCPSCL